MQYSSTFVFSRVLKRMCSSRPPKNPQNKLVMLCLETENSKFCGQRRLNNLQRADFGGSPGSPCIVFMEVEPVNENNRVKWNILKDDEVSSWEVVPPKPSFHFSIMKSFALSGVLFK